MYCIFGISMLIQRSHIPSGGVREYTMYILGVKMTLGMGKRKLTEYKKGKCITRSIFGKLPAVRSL